MKRFISLLFIVFSAWWLFHPVAQANKNAANKADIAQIIVYAKPELTSMMHVRNGKLLVVPVAKVLEGGKPLSLSKLVKQYRKKLKSKNTRHNPITLELQLQNKNKQQDTIETELVNISNLGKQYLKIEVKQSSDFSKDLLSKKDSKLNVAAVIFEK